MATMTDLKKALAPMAEQTTKLGKTKRFEIDTEKVAKAMLTEPAEMISKSDDSDADALAEGLIKRVTLIRELLDKAEEDKEGRTFVTTDDDDALATEFEAEKAVHPVDDDDEEEKLKRKKTKKSTDDDWDDDDATGDEEPEWPADLAGDKPSRVRKRTKREEVISTDPSKRRQIRKRSETSEREARQDKRDRVRANQHGRHMS